MKKILVVVDMQNDFVDGSLGSKEAEEIVPAVVRKIGEPWDGIIVTLDTHGPDYLSSKEGEKLPVEHCIKGTPGWELNEEVAKALEGKDAIFVEKPTFGSMEVVNAALRIIGESPSVEPAGTVAEVTLIGLCTDICVVSNALLLKAAGWNNMDIAVDPECCAGTSPERHAAALDTMASCQINIIN